MLKDNLYRTWFIVLVFLYNFECKKKDVKSLYPSRFWCRTDFVDVTDISKILNITNSHVLGVVKKVLIPMGLVNVEKLGRCSMVSLTEKGLDVAKDFNSGFSKLR